MFLKNTGMCFLSQEMLRVRATGKNKGKILSAVTLQCVIANVLQRSPRKN